MDRPLLIVLTGHTPDPIRSRYRDFDHWFRIAMRRSPHTVRVVEPQHGDSLPDPLTLERAVITGSAAMLTERPAWAERLAGWVRRSMDVGLPLFGVCFGHQIMCHAMGGRVDWLEGAREMGTQDIELLEGAQDDPLLHGLPRHFKAHTTHSQTVVEAPSGARVLGRSEREHHHIVRHASNALSVQFHPEFSADVIRAYLRLRRDGLRDEGLDPDALLDAVRPTPQARRILRRFGRA